MIHILLDPKFDPYIHLRMIYYVQNHCAFHVNYTIPSAGIYARCRARSLLLIVQAAPPLKYYIIHCLPEVINRNHTNANDYAQ